MQQKNELEASPSSQGLMGHHHSSIKDIAKAFIDFVADSGTLIADVAKAAVTGKWTQDDQNDLNNLINSEGYQELSKLFGNSYESVAFVVGGEGGIIIAGNGVGGVIFEPRNPNKPAGYISGGISIGTTEGATAVTGLVLNSGDISHAAGFDAYVSVQVDLGVGVAVEAFVDTHIKHGYVILVTSGEELDASFGAGHSSIIRFS